MKKEADEQVVSSRVDRILAHRLTSSRGWPRLVHFRDKGMQNEFTAALRNEVIDTGIVKSMPSISQKEASLTLSKASGTSLGLPLVLQKSSSEGSDARRCLDNCESGAKLCRVIQEEVLVDPLSFARPAYHELKMEIEGFQQAIQYCKLPEVALNPIDGCPSGTWQVLPLLMELSKKSIQQRHWQQVRPS